MTRNTDPEKMHLSSEDEHKGIEPILRAVELVRQEIQEDALKNRDRYLRDEELPAIYVTSFAYILGGWKAMVSTSWSTGHYYEVTHNKERHETYIDRYSKDYNKVVPDAVKVEENFVIEPKSQIHITTPPPGPSVAVQAAIARSATRRPRYDIY